MVDDGQERRDAGDGGARLRGGRSGGSGGGPGSSEAGRPLAGVRVLVVDDSRTVQRSAAGTLEDAGAEVVLADDGFSALATLVRTRPHALVADIVMPRLDGYQVCALVRGNAEFADLPVVLLSSRDGLFDRARGNVAGATCHLSKPVDPEALVAAVLEALDTDVRDGADAATASDR